jgi:hypothetical protein
VDETQEVVVQRKVQRTVEVPRIQEIVSHGSVRLGRSSGVLPGTIPSGTVPSVTFTAPYVTVPSVSFRS